MKLLSPDFRNFRPFGKIIEYPNKDIKGKVRNLWRIVHTEHATVGWRIAYLVLRDKTLGRLECHLDSDETFEPVKGMALIFVSDKPELEQIQCFKIDKPIIIKKGIWHGLVTVGHEAEIKVTENAKVKCRYWNFGFRVQSIGEIKSRI